MRNLFILLAVLTFHITAAQLNIDVSTLGAVGNGTTVNTDFIQQAIDSVSNNGGGEVIINNGIYMSSTIRLKSNVTLRVTSGTTLKAVPDYADFADMPFNVRSWNDTYTTCSLIFAEDASNVRITGGGTIDGNGFSAGYYSMTPKLRPHGLRIHAVDQLTIDSITLRQAPQWMAVLFDCSNVYIHDVTVYNLCFGVNDGIDIDCCRNVLVENCNLDTNDDPMPIKTHSEKVCRDVLVRNCTFATFERAVKVGNESLGALINIRFQDITVNTSSFAINLLPQTPIYLAVTDGGSADSIYFERIHINAPCQTPIFIRLSLRGLQYDNNAPAPVCKYLRNVWLRDITATATSTIPCSITGIPGHPVENINFENVMITEPGNGPLTTGNVPEQITSRPENDIWGDSLPPYGLYVRHVNGLHLDSFCVFNVLPEARPFYYFEDTTGITGTAILNHCSPSLGLNDTKLDETVLYPNPVSDILYLKNIPPNVETVTLYSPEGKQIAVIPVSGKTESHIRVSDVPSGIYFLTVAGKDYLVNRKVIIVR